jgi:hypothetical protein
MIDIPRNRLINQQIAGTSAATVQGVVARMGAMQAQDYAMLKWAVGIRLPNSTDQDIEAAMASGEVIRIHVLRPTWHLVIPSDVRWMLALSSPQILAAMRMRDIGLELSDEIYVRCNSILDKVLRNGTYLTKDEIMAEFSRSGLEVDADRTYHILAHSEMEGVVCSGPTRNGKQTYALLEERIPPAVSISKEEALVRLAKIYFTGRGPATLQDFVWWSGLSVRDARIGLEAVRSDLNSETIDLQTYWFDGSASTGGSDTESLYVLPAFDEYIISYRDREALLPFKEQRKVVSINGIFRPTIVRNGQVVGIWNRTTKKDKVLIHTDFFSPPDPSITDELEKRFTEYGRFLGKQVLFD